MKSHQKNIAKREGMVVKSGRNRRGWAVFRGKSAPFAARGGAGGGSLRQQLQLADEGSATPKPAAGGMKSLVFDGFRAVKGRFEAGNG